MKVIGILIVGLLLGCEQASDAQQGAVCESDADCVPASCCHSSTCVHVGERSDCSGIFCTQDCQPGTLDCGQGSCGCIDGQCVAQIA